jgi:hypothetical protein
VACLGLGSATWSVKSRDTFIGWDKKTKEWHLHFVANNVRFLLLPWVKVKCLASKILALNIRSISNDWMNVYHHPLYLLETFVEQAGSKAPATGPPTGSKSAKPKVLQKAVMIIDSTIT